MPDEEAAELFALAFIGGTVLRDLIRVIRNHVVDHSFECTRIADLFQAAGSDDRVRIALVIPQCFKYLFGKLAGQRAVINATNQS